MVFDTIERYQKLPDVFEDLSSFFKTGELKALFVYFAVFVGISYNVFIIYCGCINSELNLTNVMLMSYVPLTNIIFNVEVLGIFIILPSFQDSFINMKKNHIVQNNLEYATDQVKRELKSLKSTGIIYGSVLSLAILTYFLNAITANVYSQLPGGDGNITSLLSTYKTKYIPMALFMIVLDSVQVLMIYIVNIRIYIGFYAFRCIVKAQAQTMINQMEMKTNQTTLDLKEFVQDHNTLIKKYENFKSAYQIVVSAKMSLCVLVFAIATSLIADHPELSDEVMGDFLVELLELIAFIKIGDDIHSSLEEIGQSAYCSQWHTESHEYRNIIQMIIIRSQITKVPKAFFGCYYIVFPLAIDVIQCSYSYYRVITTLKKGHQMDA